MTKRAVLYGLSQCDSCRKARRWLDEHGIEYDFIDIRRDPPDQATLGHWIDQAGLAVVVNKKSTAWRQLDAQSKDDLDGDGAVDLLRAHPTLIKRPVLVANDNATPMIGFQVQAYSRYWESS